MLNACFCITLRHQVKFCNIEFEQVDLAPDQFSEICIAIVSVFPSPCFLAHYQIVGCQMDKLYGWNDLALSIYPERMIAPQI